MERAKKPKTIQYNPAHGIDPLGSRRMRWVENASLGLRVAGAAHDIIRLDHTGWFLDPLGDGETVHGTVLRLPRAAGEARFLAAVSDAFNPDCYIVSMERFDTDRDAAYEADHMAALYAEAERDYQTRDTAACMIESDFEEIRHARANHSALVREMRAMRGIAGDAPGICKALRSQLAQFRGTIKLRRAEIRKLREDPYAWLY